MTARVLVIFLLVLPGAAILQPSCSPAAELPTVAASIHPVADLLSRLAGQDFGVTSLFGPGIHPREPKAVKADLPEGVQLYVRVGGTFEGTSDSREAAGAGRVLNLSAGLELIGEAPEAQIERRILAAALGADTPPGRDNPWFWLDPLKAVEAAELMAAALTELRPEAAGRIEKRTSALKEELLQLHAEVTGVLEKARGGTFAVFATSWSYFARRYGLREVQLAAVVPGGGPGRHSLKGAAARLRGTGAARAFTDLTFPLTPAEAVAARAGVDLVVLHPLGLRGSSTSSYFSIIRQAAGRVAGETL